MKIERFQQINESSISDFLTNYEEDIKKSISLLNKLKVYLKGCVEDSDCAKWTQKQIEKRFSIYDTNVQEKIENWIFGNPTPEKIADFAIKNQDIFGTEPQMILYAIEDYAEECGIYHDEIEKDENDEFYEGSFQFDEDEDDGKNESTKITLFENFESHTTYECSGSPKP